MKGLITIKQKIDAFVKKYYVNRLLRGSIVFFSLLVFSILLFATAEYYAWFSSQFRQVLFLLGIGITTLLLIYYMIVPLSKLYKLSKTLSLRQSAELISSKIPDIKDKLINIIELGQISNQSHDIELIEAAINQKSDELKLFDFRKAVDFKVNYKYLRYLLIILLIFTGLMITNPAVITDGTNRIINYNQYFEKPTLVQLELQNKSLYAKRGDNVEISVKSVGEVNPVDVYVSFGGNDLRMRKDESQHGVFVYTFHNLNNDINFRVKGGDYSSQSYQIKVLSPPLITGFSLTANPPSYTGEPDTVFHNIGDISVPAGTVLRWNFSTYSTDTVILKTEESLYKIDRTEQTFSHRQRVMNDFLYSVKALNQNFSDQNFINYKITVIPDLYPQIAVEQKIDSTTLSSRFFRGYIQDDYGISQLLFKYRILKQSDNKPESDFQSYKIPVTNTTGQQEFYYSYDFSHLKLDETLIVEYFFEVFDNDAVRGAKSTKSQAFYYTEPGFEEKFMRFDKTNKSAQNSVNQAIKKAQEIKKTIQEYERSSIDNSSESWEKRQFLQDLSNKQNELRNLIEQSKSEIEKAKRQLEEQEHDEELLKKLEELQKMTDEILTDEIRELMDEINKLLEQFDEKRMEELMRQQGDMYQDLDKMLDRNLELLKRFKIEQKADQIANEMMNLSDEMQKLSEETKGRELSDEALLDKQNSIEEKFDMLQEQYEQLLEENKDLERPYKLDDFDSDMEQIKQEFSESKEMLEKGKQRPASQSQEKGAEQMKEVAEKMKQMMEGNTMTMNMENVQNLKTLVQNLLTLSFEQEDNYKNLQRITPNDPKYGEYGERQIQLRNEYNIVADSLFALSKRMFNLASIINKETSLIKQNFDFAIDNLRERKTSHSVTGQIKLMESFNNLALMLSQMVEQMENMQASGSGEGGDPNNPQPAFDGLKQQQENLKKQLENMLQKMKEQGDNPGQMPTSQELAEMLARQEIFRQKLEEMKSKHSLSEKTQKLLDEITELTKQSERELMNKQVSPDLMKRQQLIETRLLEAEQAENERETDPERESTTAREEDYISPENIFKDIDRDSSIRESLNRNAIILTPYYRRVFENYSNRLTQ